MHNNVHQSVYIVSYLQIQSQQNAALKNINALTFFAYVAIFFVSLSENTILILGPVQLRVDFLQNLF
jgi:hypothetical protein